MGVGLTMLAGAIANSVNPQSGSSSNLALEIAGVANYLMTIVGFMAVVTIILAGVFLILSVSDSLKDKAKTIIKTAVVALIGVTVSYAKRAKDDPALVPVAAGAIAIASTILRGKKELSPRGEEALRELLKAALKLARELE